MDNTITPEGGKLVMTQISHAQYSTQGLSFLHSLAADSNFALPLATLAILESMSALSSGLMVEALAW